MNIQLLQDALSQIKRELEHSISTASFDGKDYDNGVRAKEGLIRSQRLILKVHEVVKRSLDDHLHTARRSYEIHPPIGASSPELPITGFIKKKQQDIVVLFDDDCPRREQIKEGPLQWGYDVIGKEVSERSIVIGVRSQLSSVAKNFDTLMERAFAETLNLRLRLPQLVMGEVYLLPVVEYDDVAMRENEIAFKNAFIPIEKFVRVFAGISGRAARETDELYKYERTALVLADFRENPPELCLTPDDLVTGMNVDERVAALYDSLSPQGFAADICAVHGERHPPR